MIDLETLDRVARMKRIKTRGNAEKDYFQEIALLAISREIPRLVFKGGTAVYKFHGLDRFSEDLDFSGDLREQDVKKIAAYLKNFGALTETKSRTVGGGILATLRIRGFLYSGTAQSECSLRIDVNRKSDMLFDPDRRAFSSLYPDIPSFSIDVMRQDEILAEKICAILTRDRARDVYDVHFLSRKGISVDLKSVNAKLSYFGTEFSRESFVAAVAAKRKVWKKELDIMLPEIPEFDAVEDEVAGMRFILQA